VAEAVGLLAEHGDDAKVLAGGQSLVPLMSLRLSSVGHVVDINSVEGLDKIESTGGEVRIGALVRQADAERDPTVTAQVPLVARALAHVGHFQIRNRGTVCGSIAHADPSSELPAVALTLGATMEAEGPRGRREIAASDFFESIWTTTLSPDELLVAVRFPVWGAGSGHGVAEVARRHGDFAMCGSTCSVTMSGGKVTRAAVALFGVSTTAVRVPAVEEALLAAGTSVDLKAVTTAAGAALSPTEDIHASADYRRRVAATVMQRAITQALKEAGQ
jgi:carbon-monoxide dehydrogenase medium subunit